MCIYLKYIVSEKLICYDFAYFLCRKRCIGPLQLPGGSCCLVENVGDMWAHVAVMPTLLAKNRPTPNVANAVTGFIAGSRVG